MSRAVAILAGALVVLAGIVVLMNAFNSRDAADLGAREAASGPGELEPVAAQRPSDADEPATSGPHAQHNVTSERAVGADQLLTALDQGNVVIVYPGTGRAPAPLRALQEQVSGPFDPQLAAAGQMVILTGRRGQHDVQALAYRRRLRAGGPDDPRIRAFAEAWLGKGRGKTG